MTIRIQGSSYDLSFATDKNVFMTTDANADVKIRPATHQDLADIVRLLADDPLGSQRENFTHPLPEKYKKAFKAIEQDENCELIVAEEDGQIVATLQLNILQYLTYQGGRRAQIEAVRVAKERRGRGIGRMLFSWAISKARFLGCHLIQLTTDKNRPNAVHFYEDLGFKASHEGMKLHLT